MGTQTPAEPRSIVADLVAWAIFQSRLSVSEIARRSGVSRKPLARKMRGEDDFTFSELVLIARALDLDPAAWLRELADRLAVTE
jgi:transcriptional regulator with XRE-family HTH domain